MRKIVIVLILWLFLVLTCLSGCETVRQTAIDISVEEVKNTAAAREVALNYLSIWSLQSGFIKGALGPRMDELPQYAIDAINELDQLAEKCADPNNCSDYDLGLSLGLRVRLLTSIVAEALKFYAPDILELVPFLF